MGLQIGSEAYLWSQGADVFVGFQPPATAGAERPEDDPVMDTAYISEALVERRFGFVTDLNFPYEVDVLHSRMRELRDNWVWLGYTDWDNGWQGFRVRRFIYVRKDSPHRDVLIANLNPIIAATPAEIDLNFRPEPTWNNPVELSTIQKLRRLGLVLVPRG